MAQAQSFQEIGTAVDAFYTALGEGNEDNRERLLKEAVFPGAQLVSVGAKDAASGDATEYAKHTTAHFERFTTTFEEIERYTDYYADAAVVNSLVKQVNTEIANEAVYELSLWFTLHLVFDGQRWYVAHAQWVAEGNDSIYKALQQDTLWHVNPTKP